MYEQLLDEGIRPSGSIWYIMGSDYLKIGQPAKAKDALASLKPLVKTSLDSIWMINLEASIAAAEGDYQSAYSKSSEFGSAIVEDGDRRISHLASGILMEALRKNYILERKVSRAERQKKNILAVAGVLAVFALLLLCLYLYALLKAKRRDMESIGSQVMELKIEVDELNKNADAKDRETKAEIQRFLLERVNFLNDLCEAWFRHKNMVKMNGIIRELEKLRGEDNRLKLEKIINRCSDNVMERFRVVFPDLPQEHYSYVMYHIAGFSTGSIAVLLGKENANAVYGVKARIKEQLGRNTLPEAAELRNRLGL